MAVQLKHLHTSTDPPSNNSTRSDPPPLRRAPPPYAFMRDAELGGRAQELIQSGAVTPIPPKDAAAAMESQGYRLLDIRPQWEREKARVSGSLHVPLFVEDKDTGPITLLKKWVHFGYIGLWTVQLFTMANPSFLQQVEEAIPDADKDSKLLVACGKGLRSLMAVTKLYKGGYKNLGWLAGGFIRATNGDFPAVEGSEKLEYATIGGSSHYLSNFFYFKLWGRKLAPMSANGVAAKIFKSLKGE